MELSELTSEQIIDLYSKLKENLESFESDIEYTREAMEDKLIDYNQKTEFRNDIKYDKEQIAIINEQLEAIEIFAQTNDIELEKSINR